MDLHKNFAHSTLASPPSGTGGTSLTVATGHGSRFPTAPFNATIWPNGTQPTFSNSEIVRVTNKSTDTFTVTRAQESTSARTFAANDHIAATVTARTLTDAEYGAHGWFNVKDPVYGAVGDGVTDDTAAIQAALTAAGTSVSLGGVDVIGASVYAPAGHYRTSSALVIPDGVRLVGAGSFRGTRIAPLAGFSGTAVLTSEVGGSLVECQIEHLEVGIDVTGVNGIYLDTCQQRTLVRNVFVNGGGGTNVGGYGIKVDSSTPGSTIHIGVRLDNVWCVNPGTWPLIIGPGQGTVVTNFHGEYMPTAKASILIDGTGYSNSGLHYIDGVHHESSAHSGYIVDIVAGMFCTIRNLYSAVINNTDVGVRMAAATYGNVVENLFYAITNGVAIEDNNTQVGPRSITDSYVVKYCQDASQLTSGKYGAIYPVRVIPQTRAQIATSTPVATDCRLGDRRRVQVNLNVTMSAPTNAEKGQRLTYTIVQDSTGGWTVAWDAAFKVSWSDTGNTASKRSTISFWYDGTNWNQDGAQTPYV